jgi:GNAT superfamily N-acetyltransferase
MGWDYDAWHRNTLGRSDFDPSLCYVVQAGEEIVAATLNLTFGDQGWIRTLGVRRPWRRSGVGLALLHQSFGEYYRRGVRTVALGVDAGNPTGATRLYEKAGMRPVLQFDFYQKMLRQEGGG